MSVEQILQKEIEESRTWLDQENEESTYKHTNEIFKKGLN